MCGIYLSVNVFVCERERESVRVCEIERECW